MILTKRKVKVSNATEDKNYEKERRPLNLSIILNVIKAVGCYRKASKPG